MHRELERLALLERQIAARDAQIRAATEPFAPPREQLQQPSRRHGEHGTGPHRRDRPRYAPLWLPTPGVVGGGGTRAPRECGDASQGAHAEGQSVSPSGIGTVRVGGTEDAHGFRADVSALRKPSGAEKAAMAVAHKILAILSPRLSEGALYDEARSARQDARQEA